MHDSPKIAGAAKRSNEALLPWTMLSRQLVADCSPWLSVWNETVRLPDGRTLDGFFTVSQPDYAVVFALTESGRVLGIWHYKHGPRAVTLGLPAGYVQPGEAPSEAAERELLEETGCVAGSWQPLGSFAVDGNRGCGNAHVFLARDVRRVAALQPDDLEDFRLDELTLAEVERALVSGQVKTLGAAVGIAMGLNAINDASEK